MEEFLRNYGLWIVLGGVFVAMHWFGMGCGGGGHRHAGGEEEKTDTRGEAAKRPAHTGHAGGCH